MPTYEYICKDCGHEFEVFQSMKDDALTDCPSCENGTVRRKIGLGAGIIFKGSGFYETDFKDRKGTKPSDSGESSPKESKADSGGSKAGSSDSSSSGSSSSASSSGASPSTTSSSAT
jgi:putative FmdB family regulatory protein